MRATASFNLEDGIATSSWNATLAFLIRVSMSAIGSVIVTARRLPSPRALRHAGDLACVRHLPQADTAQTEVAVDRTRTSAPPAARIGARLELRLALLLVDQRLLGHELTPARRGGTESRGRSKVRARGRRFLRLSQSSRSCRAPCRSCRSRS